MKDCVLAPEEMKWNDQGQVVIPAEPFQHPLKFSSSCCGASLVMINLMVCPPTMRDLSSTTWSGWRSSANQDKVRDTASMMSS